MACFFPVEHREGFCRRGGLVGLSPDPVSIIEIDACVAVPIEFAHGLLHLAQLIIAQVRQSGLDFTNVAHARNIWSSGAKVQPETAPLRQRWQRRRQPTGSPAGPCRLLTEHGALMAANMIVCHRIPKECPYSKAHEPSIGEALTGRDSGQEFVTEREEPDLFLRRKRVKCTSRTTP